ncbi:MAG: glycosyltransferase [Clostridia bacterium]|nr:glycosyltransferase [Clostridia bacterium]
MNFEENKTMRIAQIMGEMNSGGVESCIMNYYRNIDKSKIQFDFIVNSNSKIPQKNEIEKLGGRIFVVPGYKNIFKYMKSMFKILKENKYDIVHSNVNSLSVFPLFIAKKAGVKIRIAHNHSTSNKKEWGKNIIKNILKLFSKKYATHYFACSNHAAEWLFGKKLVNDGKVTVIKNAIDLNKFKYNELVRKELRENLKIENKFVIGNVGRFQEQKNHEFLIDIFNEVYKINKNAILLLIGEGPLKAKIHEKVNNLNLNEVVYFLGVKENVSEYFQAMDLFLFPSLYEGLGMVAVEAQCSNLPVICSTAVPENVKLSNNIEFLDLSEDKKIWRDTILKKYEIRKDNTKVLFDAGYNVKNAVDNLQMKYFELLNGKKKKYAFISSGFLPIPAVNGGAVESLVDCLIDENEKEKEVEFTVISDYDKFAKIKSENYFFTKFVYVENNKLIKIIDYIVYNFMKYIMHKSDMHKYRFIFKRLYFLNYASKILKKENFDKIILENHQTQYLALKLRNNYKKYDGKYYYHCHNIFENFKCCDKIIKKTNKFLCVSEFIANDLKNKIDEKNVTVEVLKNCIDFDIFDKELSVEEKALLMEKFQIEDDDNVIIYTGRIIPEKGILELIESLKYVEEKYKLKLLVVGGAISKIKVKTEFENKLNMIMKDYNNKIIMTGYIDNKELYKYYKLSNIAVLPSIWEEPAGLTMLEAIACDIPLITTKSGGIPEYIDKEYSIILEKTEDLSLQIAKNIKALIDNKDNLEERINEAKNKAMKFNKKEFYKNFMKCVGENNEI